MKHLKLENDKVVSIMETNDPNFIPEEDYSVQLKDNIPVQIGWVKDGDYIFPPDATEEQKQEIIEKTDRYRKEQQILQLLQKQDKVEALVKQANLTRKFLVAIWKALPKEIKRKVNRENQDLMKELIKINQEINRILSK